MNKFKCTLSITIAIAKEGEEVERWITVGVKSQEQIDMDTAVEEWCSKAVDWGQSWLQYPYTEVTIKN